MHVKTLEELARDRGYWSQLGGKRLLKTAEAYIAYLISQDEGDHTQFIMSIEDQCNYGEIVRQILEDKSAFLGLTNDASSVPMTLAQRVAGSATHTTHHSGIRGEQVALTSLNDHVLMRNMGPTRTSSLGLLCGARAVAASYIAMYNALRQGGQIIPQWSDWLTEKDLSHRLMQLLFTYYTRDCLPEEHQTGIMTRTYSDYVEQEIGRYRDTDRAVYEYGQHRQ
ncbi:hypothetical protein DOTSEDRAFT_82601 [Dothistroma septosporum NZE10]|uniref:Uncharacterized protein n=1 Tax=Dothistroma septosporum (strain NZE10 / CBS 128990) TaxID=675120 RepID=N1PDZ9_DOTSN|nr:hypothetical protein DOTSEDRAFT_82601 [Dothistroma septosporum NZE10]